MAFQEEEKKFIATLAENSAATEEELIETIKNSASGKSTLFRRNAPSFSSVTLFDVVFFVSLPTVHQ